MDEENIEEWFLQVLKDQDKKDSKKYTKKFKTKYLDKKIIINKENIINYNAEEVI